jgi:integrase/recombinase XerD
MNLDIHNYDAKTIGAEKLVQQSDISARNKELILGYREACLLKGTCGRVRLIRVLGVLLLYARLLKKDADKLAREDIERVISGFLTKTPPYSPETISTYKAIIKNFMTWVLQPDQFPTKTPPAMVAWITCHVRSRDKHRLERRDLLTPEDIEKLLAVCHNTRDKALIAMLWETGCRIAEVGNLQLRHITKQPTGYTLDVDGKTGQRSPLIISSAPYLTQWLQNHPFKDRPDSPLWVHYQYATEPKQLKYDSIRYLLVRYFKRAGITKPCRAHSIRHARVTFCLANNIFGSQAAKQYFGWSASSDMLATYAHLVDQDANNAILRENNLTPQQQTTKDLAPIECPICKELNQTKAEYCVKCGAVLDLKKAYEHQAVHALKDDVVMNLMKLLVERGLVDEAVQQIHNADLGPTLRRLVEHHEETQRTRPQPTPPPTPPSAQNASSRESVPTA